MRATFVECASTIRTVWTRPICLPCYSNKKLAIASKSRSASNTTVEIIANI